MLSISSSPEDTALLTFELSLFPNTERAINSKDKMEQSRLEFIIAVFVSM